MTSPSGDDALERLLGLVARGDEQAFAELSGPTSCGWWTARGRARPGWSTPAAGDG